VRIAVDARELRGRSTGVGRYLRALLQEWKTLPSAAPHEVILCAPPEGTRGGTLWEQRVLPRLVRETRADVLFAPGYTAPVFSPAPFVVAIHDVSFAAHPEWFSWREGLRRRTLTRLAARRAARVVTISQFSKREIVTHLGVDPSKVEVIYPAAALPGRDERAVGRAFTARQDMILYVGSLFARRHLPELVEGFGALARSHPDARLEIVGDNRMSPPTNVAGLAAAAGVSAQVTVRAYVSENELAELYGRARAFVFLSEYEGFGLTPLEALAAGIPIVVLDTPVAREVYGAAALYVERPEPALIGQALERALRDEPERARILTAARETLARYSWRACAEQVLQVLVSCSTCRASR